MPAKTVKEARATPEFQRLRAQLLDPEWRIDNLYRIVNEPGQIVPFKRNPAQVAYMQNAWYRDALPKARRLGFSTLIGLLMLDRMLFVPNTACGIIDLTLKDATKKLDAIKFAYLGLPAHIRDAVKMTRDNKEAIEFSNGSRIAVGTSHRGGGLQMLHVSEYGKISAFSPDVAREIRNGAFPTVAKDGKITIESTAHGTSGEFADMVNIARKKRDERAILTPLDFKLQFFGWWMKPDYVLPQSDVIISQEMVDYFVKLEREHGVRLTPEQRAWYAKTRSEHGPNDTLEEYPSSVDELFFNSRTGTFFKDEMAQARRDQRVGHIVPYDPTRLVHTGWDIGEDCTPIIFFQYDGVRVRVIDYYEEMGGSIQRCAAVLDEKRINRGFKYGTHYGPHDLEHRSWENNAHTKRAIALDLGIKFEIVPKVQFKDNSIEAARRLIGMTYFDEQHAGLLVKRLDDYAQKWNKLLTVFTGEPVHDMNSHGSDAFQQIAMGLKPERESGVKYRQRPRPSGVSHWGA